MNFELRQKLSRVAGRIRSLRLWIGLAVCWLAWAAAGILLLELSGVAGWNSAALWPTLAVLAAATAVAWAIIVSRSARDDRAVARRVEARHPELGTLLLTAVEQASLPRVPGKGPTFLQATVIRQALEHGRHHDWPDAVATWKLWSARLVQFLALGLLIAVCAGMASRRAPHAASGLSWLPGMDAAGGDYHVKVDPGDAEIERGTPLLVVAEFAQAVPPDARLVMNSASNAPGDDATQPGGAAQTIDMVRSLNDPKFVGRVSAVRNDMTYLVEFAGQQSAEYRVRVFDYPELVRADAQLEFPTYTSLAPTVVEDVRHVTAVEGTRLTLVCRLNKEVSDAKLVDADGVTMTLRPDNDDRTVYRAGWLLARSRRLKLQLVDAEGRPNRLPAEFVVNVTPSRPPRIVVERPARDVEVSPLEELQVKAVASDDFGVERVGLSYSLGGAEPRELDLTEPGSAKSPASPATEREVNYLVDFEALKAKPDDLLSYFVWAEDYGPDGKLRRTLSDMYFAEVRPFDEIYRQGEQPSESEQRQQQAGGAAQQTDELAELQKEIINATWKLLRRETGAEPSPELADDRRLVAESQQSAIEQLEELAQRVDDAELQSYVDGARRPMAEAHRELTAAAEGPATAPLRPALSAEQGAYQALLKLRALMRQQARGSQVVRGAPNQRGSRAGNPSSRSQRQLDQLELTADENRYESQRRAGAPENAAQRESREILNRLKDLARRQDDLNERLRELQSALQQAENSQRRAELERELKRLRDQQQEVLRDTDELISRMEQSQNQPATSDARRQMEDGRAHVQQAAEALENGQLSQALTEGTRAGRQLSEVRDQFRRQSASQFSEEMTELRRQARALDERQQRLTEQLENGDRAAGRSLRDSGSRAETREGIAEQKRELNDLLERMQETIQEAEEPEPLLARQLYDTVRDAHHERVPDALEVTQRLLEIGVDREAEQAMRSANQGIRNLRQGVERAAESVLGDEAEALRRAQREVERLADELNREIEQAPGADRRDGRNEDRPSQTARGERGGEQSDDGRQLPGGQQDRGERGSADEGQDRPSEGPSRENPDPDEQPGDEPRADGDGGRVEGPQGSESERGRPAGQPPEGDRRQRAGQDGRDADWRGGIERVLENLGGGRPGGPITGEDFRGWSDRIRDVEEMLDDPELRGEAARIRDRAADARADFKRHSKVPDWSKLQELVAEPLNELGRRIGEEIRRRQSPDSLVPIDRDPVPPEFADGVRRYYERLGSGE